MNPAVQTIFVFLLMGGLCAVLERVWPQDPSAPHWRSDSLTDVFYFLIRVFLSVALAVATGFAGTALPNNESKLGASLPFFVQILLVLFLSDFIQYWTHMVMHYYKPLWYFHAVHHSPEQIDWLVAARVHPIELGINKAVSSAPLYLLGFSPNVFAVTVPLAAAYSLLIHSNLSWTYGPLGYVVASPAFHRWHHSSDSLARDKNFAQTFSFIDFLFGTAYFPRGEKPEKFGLVHENMPRGVWRQFVYPLREWFGRVGHTQLSAGVTNIRQTNCPDDPTAYETRAAAEETGSKTIMQANIS